MQHNYCLQLIAKKQGQGATGNPLITNDQKFTRNGISLSCESEQAFFLRRTLCRLEKFTQASKRFRLQLRYGINDMLIKKSTTC